MIDIRWDLLFPTVNILCIFLDPSYKPILSILHFIHHLLPHQDSIFSSLLIIKNQSFLPQIYQESIFPSSNSHQEMGAMVARDHTFHVLAVDDSIVDRKLIEKLLKTSSFQVTVVDSPTKALRFLGLQEGDKENSYCPNDNIEISLIITDYCMPGMTGYELLKKIKESSSSLKDVPVVVMSSENEPARIKRCLEQGADDFFLKPVKQSDVNKLKSNLVGRRAMNLTNWSSSLLKPIFH